LNAELETVRPQLIICLGAVAAQALLGPKFRITQSHGEIQEVEGFPPIVATLHPSAILRARTDEDRNRDKQILIDDLRRVAAHFEDRIEGTSGCRCCPFLATMGVPVGFHEIVD